VDLDTDDGESTADLDQSEGSYSYTYDNEGVYTAELTLRLTDGSTIRRSTTVGVSDGQADGTAPDIDQFQADPDSGTAPLNVTFDWNISGGHDLICTVDAGDGSAPATITDCDSGNYTHSYQEPGLYVPSLTVQDGDGNVATAAAAVTVFPAGGGSGLIEDFTADPAEGDLPLATDFTWELGSSADTWLFFGDGSTPHGSSGATGTAAHTYEDGGNFRSVLLAVDANGDADVALLPIRVVDPALVPTAIVRTGSTTLSLDADERGLLAPLLGTLLPDSTDLTVLDNEALLDTNINLFGLLEAVAVNAGSDGLEAVLLGAVDLTDVIDGLLDLVGGTAAAAPLQSLLGLLPTGALPVELGDLINVVDPEELVNLQDINLQVLDVLVLALQLFNSENVLDTPEPIELGLAGTDGLLDLLGLGSLVSGTLDSGSLAKVYLQVVEPPVLTLARIDRIGTPDVSFRSAGVRLALDLEGLGLSLDLDDDSAPDGL
ncbi:MAG TPA: PKD domain-containing protein, partial [Deinococcales bacterium]|nr:PKD domain-containing protein [Deinococcales bacterium]